ncbi:efflux RND transporter periplasmic adaptor subunit [Xanthovirga aplysinae]|uniref:efflux RND transporter periplasmic adaptor subunit n=1 Tax=Xanthovirga aplysinae TaxID=2529853 RepID=UPI0012BBB8F7|nr:efflux RND transporter periplasmic adaptor subunit [Xanthovirga aplysinae]MTI32723.1 efflux RND transporter periplasmic adaptor subunit [Xanthovirga aplysinae]
MKAKVLIVLTLTLVVIGAMAWKLSANKKVIDARREPDAKESFAIPVRVTKAKKINLEDHLQFTGEFEAKETVTLISESTGIVKQLKIKEGDRIKKGANALKIDDSSLQSQLHSVEISLQKAVKDLERYQKVQAAGAVSRSQIEDIELGISKLEAQKAGIKQQISFSVVSSPINGVVNDVFVEKGEFVMAGTKVAEVIDTKKLQLILKVSEKDLLHLKEGMKVKITTDVYPLEEYEGTLVNISHKADPSKKFKVKVMVNNNENKSLRAGMFAKAYFHTTNVNQQVLSIPRKALTGSLKEPKVFVVKKKKVTLIPITIGSSKNNQLTVLSGLKSGDQVVVSGQLNLKEGSEIKIVKN